MTGQRFLYYTGWCTTDAAVIAAGLGYKGIDPKTGKHSFDKITSIRILEVEFGLSPTIMI
jgi:lysophospholipid acyltransferase